MANRHKYFTAYNPETLLSQKPDYDFGFWANPLLAPVLGVLWFGLLVDFRRHPEWDMAVANYFYDPNMCANAVNYCLGFPLAQNPITASLREAFNEAPVYIGILLLIWIGARALAKIKWSDPGTRNLAAVTASLLIGPLLLVNGFLKEFFGRTRPRMIESFGGTMDFTLPGDIVGQCISNCSFVSGEASAAGWLLCLGLLFPPNWRRYAYAILFIIGAFFALLRISFGAHFISDVLLGYGSSIIVCAIIVQTIIQVEKALTKPTY